MAKCKNCKNLYYAEVVFKHGTSTIPWCRADDEDIEDIGEERECFDFECMTNADRIRSMSDEELAEFLCEYDACHLCECNDSICYLKDCEEVKITEEWLKSEVGCE